MRSIVRDQPSNAASLMQIDCESIAETPVQASYLSGCIGGWRRTMLDRRYYCHSRLQEILYACRRLTFDQKVLIQVPVAPFNVVTSQSPRLSSLIATKPFRSRSRGERSRWRGISIKFEAFRSKFRSHSRFKRLLCSRRRIESGNGLQISEKFSRN